MRRLRRIIFNGLTVLSLVMCVGTAAVWMTSYSGALVVGRGGSWGQSGAVASLGLLLGIHERVVQPHARDTYAASSRVSFDPPARSVDRYGPPWSYPYHYGKVYINWGGVKYGSGERGGCFARFVQVPLWLVSIAFGMLPMLWIGRKFRRRQLQRGLCAVCSYDLRATPERCPECGAIPSKAEA